MLTSGLDSLDLTQVRSTGAFLGFALVLALVHPQALRVTRRELPFPILFGATGVAFVLSIVVQIWSGGGDLDSVGIAAAIAAAVAYAVYILMAERGVRIRDPISLSCYGFLVAAVFWAFVQPLWLFPTEVLDAEVSLLGNLERFEVPLWALLAFIVVVGTMVTFSLIVGSLRYVPATRVGIIAMLEPVAAALVAYLWLGESLGAAELVGGAIVLTGILLAQTSR